MRLLSGPFIVGLLSCLVMLPMLHAQAASPRPPDSSTVQSTPVPGDDQAPDATTKKITDLVHAGKYTEAQQLTTGLLVAYPDDQRLIKAKALIEELLAPVGPTGTISTTSQPAQPAANANAEQLTGMDKIDYNALILLAHQAQQSTDLDEQKKLLQQFTGQSAPFLQKHPDLPLLWQFRVVSAISLNEPMLGYEAGQRLLDAGAADSSDPVLQNLLAQLRNKGWLDEQEAKKQAKYDWILGIWVYSWTYLDKHGKVVATGNSKTDFSRFDSTIRGCAFNGSVKPYHFSDGDCTLRIEVLDTGEIRCKTVDEPNGWQVVSCEAGDQNRSMTILFRSTKGTTSGTYHKE